MATSLRLGCILEVAQQPGSRATRRPPVQLTSPSLPSLLQFRSAFTAPSFNNFQYIATGWCLSHRHRYVTEMIQSSGAVHHGHHSRYHRFFSDAAWSIDDLYAVLARRA